MSPLILIFWGLLIVSVGITLWGYRRGYGALSGRSRLFRTSGMGLLDLLIFLGLVYLTRSLHNKLPPLQMLSFLAAFLGLGVSLVCIALLDALESVVAMRRVERQVMQQVIEETARQKNVQ